MKVLCFGTFAEVLRICCYGFIKRQSRRRNRTMPQHVLVGELLNAVEGSDFKDWSVGDNASQLARKLLRCEQHIPDELKVAAELAEASAIAAYFSKKLLPSLEKPEVAVMALLGIIKNDEGIHDSVVAQYFGMGTKGSFLLLSPINPVDFLANAFVYVIRIDNKNGRSVIREISEDYVLSFDSRVKEREWDTSSLLSGFNGANSGNGDDEDVLLRTTVEILASGKHDLSLEDLELVLEVNGKCPKCAKPLIEVRDGDCVPRYMITVIDASKPENASTNKIALCPECHDKYVFESAAAEVEHMISLKLGFINKAALAASTS